ncbi:MAG: transposase [Chloroflexi bacterium]|nr:transposase [Chloroflexota bacterium]
MAYRHSTQGGALPQPSRFAALGELLDTVDSANLLAELRSDTRRGPQGQWVEPIWRAYLASFALNLAHTNDIIRHLQDIPAFRETCGFGDYLPHRTTFNRFIQRLALHTDSVEQCVITLTKDLKGCLPDLGNEVAIDATAVRSHSNPNKGKKGRTPSDPEAAWGGKALCQVQGQGRHGVLFRVQDAHGRGCEIRLASGL